MAPNYRPSSFSDQPLESLACDSFLWGLPKHSSVSNVAMQEGLAEVQMHRVVAATEQPWNSIVRFACFAGDNLVTGGSGFLVSKRVLLTAGHCVFDRKLNTWPTEARFFGGDKMDAVISTSRTFRSTAGWVAHGDQEYDYGAIILDRPFENAGHFGLCVLDPSVLAEAMAHASGFPTDSNRQQQALFHGSGKVAVVKHELRYSFFGGKGCSGAPVWVSTLSGHRLVIGIHHRAGTKNESSEQRFALRITEGVAENVSSWIEEAERDCESPTPSEAG